MLYITLADPDISVLVTFVKRRIMTFIAPLSKLPAATCMSIQFHVQALNNIILHFLKFLLRFDSAYYAMNIDSLRSLILSRSITAIIVNFY